MSVLKTVFGICLVVVLGCGVALASGWQPSSRKTDTVPISVRDNPGSYKPSHAAHTGYHRPGSRGGGVVIVNSGRRTYGGGYSYGK